MTNLISILLKTTLGYLMKLYYSIEYKRQRFKHFNERPIEFAFVFKHISKIYPMKILDVGTGMSALPRLIRYSGFLVTAVDNISDYWDKKMANLHYHIIDDDIRNTRLKYTFDLILCISVLEHIDKPDLAMKNIFSLLNKMGHLILTVPFNTHRYIENVYELPNSSYGKNVNYSTKCFSSKELNSWLQNYGGEVIDKELWNCWEGDYWNVGRQIIPPRRVHSINDKHDLACFLIQKT